jgi:diguanylate cyclase (GGDEF)-like protein/PAS domain S-box-containing protein
LFLLVLARLAGLVRIHEARTETRLRAQFEGRLAALVSHASDVVAILDANGRLTYLSPSGARLLKAPVDDLIGRRWLEFLHPDDLTDAQRFLTDLVPGASGSLDHRVLQPDGSWSDVETLATNLLTDDTIAGIILNSRDVSDRKALERRLAHLAFHDGLTGLPSRALLIDRIQHALDRHRREGTQAAILFLDLDDFKIVNDTLGHAAGDSVLTEIAARLDSCVRACDTAARVGGDEFAVLLDGLEQAEDAVTIAERIVDSLSEPIAVGDHQFVTAPSIGIALASHQTDTAEDLVSRADTAMYHAKAQGKARFALSPVLTTHSDSD